MPIPFLNHLVLAVAVDPGLASGSGLRMPLASMKPLSSCKSGHWESALRAPMPLFNPLLLAAAVGHWVASC